MLFDTMALILHIRMLKKSWKLLFDDVDNDVDDDV